MKKNTILVSGLLSLLVLTGAGCARSDNSAQNVSSTETSNTANSVGAPAAANTTATTTESANTTGTTSGKQVVEATEVEIEDMAFQPSQVKVKRGATVTFANQDGVQHSATADNGSFDTGLMSNGEKKTVTFNTAGTFTYHCKAHPGMTGTIIVE